MSRRYTFNPIKVLNGVTAVGHALVGTAQISMDRMADASRAYQAVGHITSWVALYDEQPSIDEMIRDGWRRALESKPPDLDKHDAKFDDDVRKGIELSDTDWMLSMPLD